MARAPIHLAKAREQHRAYEEALEKFGAEIISLPAETALADSMFVEDPAMVLDELESASAVSAGREIISAPNFSSASS